MAGRKHSAKSSGGGRPQAPKRGRQGARGHGLHHKQGDGTPRNLASGRGRNEKGVRERGWSKLEDEQAADTVSFERLSVGSSKERVQEVEDAAGYGVDLQGFAARGTVLEVRRGTFLLELTQPPQLPPDAAPCPRIVRTEPRGAMQHFDLGLSSLVAAGDEVEVIVPPVSGNLEYVAMLTRVLPRKSAFRRVHPSGRAIQVLAANIDQVLIVASAAEPPFRPGFVDRILACALSSALPAKLIVNKLDLGLKEDDLELLDVYRGLGVEVLLTSATRGDGLDAFRAWLTGKCSVLCGHSGVGKSSLLRTVAPEIAGEIRVGEVSGYTSKGTHTTTHARLYRLPDGALIDAPGVREFTPVDTDRRNLWGWFPEIAALQGRCQFNDCTHTVEQGCAVLAAVAAGTIHPRRHESYVRIYKTLPA
ncbi:MAG: ribosome small subunit-dependent GTPase A [Planctomycetes bacterium]|nr:ribosome small subunit-dependent GTPase A [Planctomycetota bacterium]